MLRELEVGIETQATVDRSKMFFRIRSELSDAVRALLNLQVSDPTELLSGTPGKPAVAEVLVVNRGRSPLKELSAKLLSPWAKVAVMNKTAGLSTALQPGQRAVIKVALSIPARPQRQLLPFLLEVRGKSAGQAFRLYSPIDVVTKPDSFNTPTSRLTWTASTLGGSSVTTSRRTSGRMPIWQFLGS
ncbi:MAG: hypothetical protein IID44_15830 [Planctomycetes bacterium]|nr:hypothetical protein [Planctomycetota bacterium]